MARGPKLKQNWTQDECPRNESIEPMDRQQTELDRETQNTLINTNKTLLKHNHQATRLFPGYSAISVCYTAPLELVQSVKETGNFSISSRSFSSQEMKKPQTHDRVGHNAVCPSNINQIHCSHFHIKASQALQWKS